MLMRLVAIFALTAGVLGTALAATNWDFSDYGTNDPMELFRISYRSSSQKEKIRIRTYLAEKFSETPEGTYAIAWLSGKKNDLFAVCADKFPNFLECANAVKGGPQRERMLQRMLQRDPTFENFAPIRDYYFYLKESEGRKAEALEFFETYTEKYPNAWVFDYIRCVEAQDKKVKRELMGKVLHAESLPADVYISFMDYDAGLLFDPDKGTRQEAAFKWVRTALSREQDRGVRFHVLDAFLENYATDDMRRLLVAEMEKSDDHIPIEWYEKLDDSGMYVDSDWYQRHHALIEERGKHDVYALFRAAHENITNSSNVEKGLDEAEQAVAGAYTENDKEVFAALTLGQVTHPPYCRRGDQWARKMARNYRFGEYFYLYKIDLSWCINDIREVESDLEKVRAERGRDMWLIAEERQLARRKYEAERSQQFMTRYPFLDEWKRKTGGKVSIQIEFPPGSPKLPARYAPQLDKLAATLRKPSALNYVFEISGYTDSTGNFDTNRTLAAARAQAVADYLSSEGVSASHLRVVGYGSLYPVAENATAAGRQQNRRVEIQPIGNLDSPSIVSQGVVPDTRSLALSPDGRYMVTGVGTLQLWDVRTRTILRSFPSAGEYKFTPNGQYLVGLSNYTDVARQVEASIWIADVRTGIVLARQLIDDGVKSFSISPDSSRVAVVDYGRLDIFSLPNLKLQDSARFSQRQAAGFVTWIDRETVAAAVQYGDEHLGVWKTAPLRKIKDFPDITYVHALGMSQGGRYLVSVQNNGVLSAWSPHDWSRKTMRSWLTSDIVPHPFRNEILIDQWNGSGPFHVAAIDLDTMQVRVQTETGNQAHAGLAYSPDGRQIYMANGDVSVLDASTLKGKSFLENADTLRVNMIPLPSAGKYLVIKEGGTEVWDVASGKKVHTIPDLEFSTLLQGTLGQAGALSKDRLYTLDLATYEVKARESFPTALKGNDGVLYTSEYIVAFRKDKVSGSDAEAGTGKLQIWNRRDGLVVHTIALQTQTEDSQFSNRYPYSTGIDWQIDSSGRFVAVHSFWKDHWGYDTRRSKKVHVYELSSGKEVKSIEYTKAVYNLRWEGSPSCRLQVNLRSDSWSVDICGVSPEKHLLFSDSETIAFEDDKSKVLFGDNLFVVERNGVPGATVFTSSQIVNVGVFPGQNLLVAQLDDGRLETYDFAKLQLQLTTWHKSHGEWITYAPDGQFASSLNGANNMYWSLGENLLPFSALKSRFENPRVVEQRLRTIATGQAAANNVTVIDEAGNVPLSAPPPSTVTTSSGAAASVQAGPELSADMFVPPYGLRIVSAPNRADGTGVVLKVALRKLRKTNIQASLELSVNGRVVRSNSLIAAPTQAAICAGDVTGCEAMNDMPVVLEEGRNIVQVSLLYRDARLDTQTVVIERAKTQSQKESNVQLWFFGVGVSKYADSRIDLKYARADAEALATLLKTQEGKLYSKINTEVLTDSAATAQEVRIKLHRFLKKASQQDLVIIFLAGHGMQDNSDDLYFMAHESNPSEAYTGVNVTEIRDVLLNRPIGQKALLWLDICHAGAISLQHGRRSLPSAEDAAKILANGTGVKIFSSSTGREFSLEDEAYMGGHGAFTAALLEGMSGRSLVKNGPGYITVLDLESYVGRRVIELTEGAQHPMTPYVDHFQDYPLIGQ